MDWNVAFSVAAKQIIPEFHLSNVEIGWLISAATFGFVLACIPGGVLTDRIGPRKLLGWIMVLWSLLMVGTAYATDIPGLALLTPFFAFAVVRFLTGVAEGPTYPACNKMFANWIPVDERGTASGILSASFGVGYGITPPIFAYLMVRYGWRTPFMTFAGFGVLLALFWFWYTTDLPEDHPSVTREELARIRESTVAAPPSRQRIPASAIISEPRVWLISLVGLLIGYAIIMYQAWFYLYLVDVRKFSELGSGVLGAGPFLAVFLLGPLGGVFCDQMVARYGITKGRKFGGGFTLVLAGICIMLGAHSDRPYLAVLLLSLGDGFIYAGQTAGSAAIMDFGGPYVGVINGIMNTVLILSGIVSPVATPIIAQHLGWEIAFDVAGVMALGAGLVWPFIDAGAPMVVAAEPQVQAAD